MTPGVFKRCACPPRLDDRGRRVACRKAHGTWYYILDIGPGPGPDGVWKNRRQQKKGGFPSERDAAAARARASTSVADGTMAYDAGVTVGDYLRAWLDQKVAAGLKPTTARSYRQHIESYLVPLLGPRRLRDLRADEVERVLTGLATSSRYGRQVSPATVQRIRATLRSALASAKRKRMVSVNAATDLELPTARRPQVRPWTPEELTLFLDAAAEHEFGSLFEFVALTGLRRGEALGLMWSDLDLPRRRLVVRRQIVSLPGAQGCEICGGSHVGRRFGAPKTRGRDGGVLELASRAVATLEAHRDSQARQKVAWGASYSDHDLVFARDNGEPQVPDACTKAFVALTRSSGLRTVRFHDLRHGAASLMLAEGVDISVVSKILGHSSIAITADTYTHLLPGVGQDAAERLAARLGGRSVTTL